MMQNLERYLKPDLYCESLDDLDLKKLYHDGYRLLLIDVDNTLASHGSFEADDYAQRAIKRARDIGFDCRIVSNAGHRRIKSYAESLRMPYTALANKPSVRAILDACADSGIQPKQSVMVGDQILTDVMSAHRAGALAVLVRPRARQEAVNVRFKRLIERWLFRHFKLGGTTDSPEYQNQNED
ncbi:MAG: YqeG family HAD IIIA-type phosphatase [Clostridiaceae bacterium]|jgi:HAD superfamily phosphatase (TIGR01668 family)|nr:YqeG family HAD IIIA-type phosphatase [Eubacteriales bacterium]NLV48409.1 YqeG family HAD IIIA-type phosphatase [Clostridiaceae bacterium]